MALAIFDLDETLVRGDTASLFCRFMVDTGLADGTFVDHERELMQRYADETLSMAEYVAFMLRPLRYTHIDEIDALMPEFVSGYIEPRIYPQARSLIEHQRATGNQPLIISATPEFLVRAVARALDIQELLAIELETTDKGRYSGEIFGTPTYREGKVERLKRWLREHDASLEGASFYTDSINDLPLLEQVDHPIVTNPDPRLERIAGERGWPLMRWDDPERVGFRCPATGPTKSISAHHSLETANTGREA